MSKFATVAVLLALLIGLSGLPVLAVTPDDYAMNAPEALQEGHLYAESALLIDAVTGEALFSKNAGVRMYPASTTKIMTLMLALESGISLDQRVTVPREAADIPEGSSLVPVKPKDQLTWRDLLYGFMLSSGNDGANAVAVLCDGSLDAFVERMNARAAELGCQGTHFVNAHGYHDKNHYTTAADLAIMAREAMRNQTFREIVAAPSWQMTLERGGKSVVQDVENRNVMLLEDSKYYYPDCVGIKTGHHKKAGQCVVSAASRNGMRLICVVLNCDQEKDKWYDAARLFEYGYTCYSACPLSDLTLEAAQPMLCQRVENAAGNDPEGGILTLTLDELTGGDAVCMLLNASPASRESAVKALSDSMSVEWIRPLTAPVTQGEALGTLKATAQDGHSVSATLKASRDVKAVSKASKPQNDRQRDPVGESVSGGDTPQTPRFSGMSVAILAVVLLAAGALAGILAVRENRRRAARRKKAAARRRKARSGSGSQGQTRPRDPSGKNAQGKRQSAPRPGAKAR